MSLLLLFAGGPVGPVEGNLSILEAEDTLAASLTLDLTGNGSVIEADDVATAASALTITASAFATEGDDAGASSATLLISAAVTPLEDDDVPSLAGTIDLVGSLAILEEDDAWDAEGALGIEASTAALEDDDSFASAAIAPIAAMLGVAEESDAIFSDAQTKFTGGVVGPVPGPPAFDNTRMVRWGPIDLQAVVAFDFLFEMPLRLREEAAQGPSEPAATPAALQVVEPAPAPPEPPPEDTAVAWDTVQAFGVLALDRVVVDLRPVAAAKRRRVAAAAEAAQAHDREIVRQWLQKRGLKQWA